MMNFVIRLAKRLAVLVPGLVIAYVSISDVFPVIDRRLPVGVAILVTYILGAYLLIPLLIRVIRIVLPARHLQSYCVTPDGFASDPVNIGIIANQGQLIAAMTAAGWHVADDHSPGNVLREVVSAALNRPYHTAPMSNLYLFGRKQDIGFERPISGSRGHRHHVRFWATEYRPGTALNFGTVDWHRRRARAAGQHTLWVGAASKDVGFALIRHNVQVTHMIDPDTNSERALIVAGLTAAGLVRTIESYRLTKPYRLVNRAWRGQLRSDGYMQVVKIRADT